AAADDDDLSNIRRRMRTRRLAQSLGPDERHLALNLDLPAVKRIERRRAEHFSGAQAEAGVVERAADRLAAVDAVGERAAIVRAGAAAREQLAVEARQQHGLVADPSAKRRPFGNVGKLH